MARVYVVPGEGRSVKLPDSSWVPATGMEIERDQFVERRIMFGDLVVAAPPKPAPAPKAETKA